MAVDKWNDMNGWMDWNIKQMIYKSDDSQNATQFIEKEKASANDTCH